MDRAWMGPRGTQDVLKKRKNRLPLPDIELRIIHAWVIIKHYV
jgi:hypothetical protein